MPADQNSEILVVDNELRSDTAWGTASRELVNYLKPKTRIKEEKGESD